MAQSRDLTVRIDGDSSGFEREMKKAQRVTSAFEQSLRQAQRATANIDRAIAAETAKRHKAMTEVGKGAMVAGAAMAAGLALAANAAVKWESAWAGVNKTVDGSAEQMNALEGELRDMAKSLPATHGEIAAVAEAAGQLGVKRQDIAKFTKVMIDLGETTNLSADDAATAIAQMANVMGTSADEIDNLGSTLVALGNAGASTERDIMDMALRLAGAGKLIGASESDVLAMANAMASMGIEAELGGGAMSRTILKIYGAVKGGGAQLEQFAAVAGTSAGEFAKQFEDAPVKAIDSFVQGLNRIDESGGNVMQALGDLGIKGTQDLQVLLRLKGAGDLMAESLDLGAKAWKANNALQQEASKRYETTAAKMQVAKNQLNDLAIDIGSALLPALSGMSSAVSGVADFLGDLPGPVKGAATALGVLAAATGIVGGAALIAVPKIAAMKVALETLGVSAGRSSKLMGAAGAAMKGGAVVAGAAATAAALFAVIDSFDAAGPKVNELTDSLADFAEEGKLTGAMLRVVGQDFDGIAEKVRAANSSQYWSTAFGRGEVRDARKDLAALDQTLAGLVAGGNADLAKDIFGRMAAEVEAGGGKISELNESFGLYGEALAGVSAETKLAKAPTQDFNTELGATKEEAEAAAKALEELADIVASFVSPLGAYQTALAAGEEASQASAEKSAEAYNQTIDDKIKAAGREYDARLKTARDTEGISDEAVQKIEDERDATVAALEDQKKSWEDYADAVTVSVADYLTELERQVEAQQNWQANMLVLAGKVSQSTLDELARLGPEGAPLVASLVNASDEELARLEAAFDARSTAATTAWADALRRAKPVLTAVAGTAGAAAAAKAAEELAAGKTTIAAVAEQFGLVIESGVVRPMTEAETAARNMAEYIKSLSGTGVTVTVTSSGVHRSGPHGGGTVLEGSGGTVPVKKSAGGPVWGAGTGTSDSIPAYLSNGEYVVNAAATYRNRPLLERINSGHRIAYATGGIVSTSPVSMAGGGVVSGGSAGAMRLHPDDLRALANARGVRDVVVNAQTGAGAHEIVDEAVFAARVGRF